MRRVVGTDGWVDSIVMQQRYKERSTGACRRANEVTEMEVKLEGK